MSCRTCRGRGEVTCDHCEGAGMVERCFRCSIARNCPQPCRDEEAVECPVCKGQKVLMCTDCDGTGWGQWQHRI